MFSAPRLNSYPKAGVPANDHATGVRYEWAYPIMNWGVFNQDLTPTGSGPATRVVRSARAG